MPSSDAPLERCGRGTRFDRYRGIAFQLHFQGFERCPGGNEMNARISDSTMASGILDAVALVNLTPDELWSIPNAQIAEIQRAGLQQRFAQLVSRIPAL